jgi:hypothetical protein
MAKAVQAVRRASFQVVFGDGVHRWSMPDPSHPVVKSAQRCVRYGDTPNKHNSDALVLADVASAIDYLVHTCPTTKLACEKLAAMRAAVRELGPVADDSEAQ